MHDALCEMGFAMRTESSAHYVIIVRFVQKTVFSKYSAGTQCHVSGVVTWDEYSYLFSSKTDVCLPCSLHLFRGRTLHRSCAKCSLPPSSWVASPEDFLYNFTQKPTQILHVVKSGSWLLLNENVSVCSSSTCVCLVFYIPVGSLLCWVRYWLVLQWHCSSLQ